jgi:hypothetical protein
MTTTTHPATKILLELSYGTLASLTGLSLYDEIDSFIRAVYNMEDSGKIEGIDGMNDYEVVKELHGRYSEELKNSM